jgi:hypothetical protein
MDLDQGGPKTSGSCGSEFPTQGSYLPTPPVQVLETADSGDEKAITAMGLLNTMETILAVMEEKPEVRRRGGTLLCTLRCWNDQYSKGLDWSAPSIAAVEKH